jgi:delta(3,5)-delta(2,4)-dienoyl-CoA isomerase
MAVPPQQAPRERNERRVSGVRGTQCCDLLTRLHTRYWLEYGAAFERIAEDPTVRVVVVSSALEKAFSAGVDRAWNRFASSLITTKRCAVSDLLTPPRHTDPARRALLTRSYIRDFQHAIGAPTRTPQPVIGAVHGVAFGLALDLLSALDVRLAASDAAFSIKEVDVGIAPDIGTLARMPRLVGNTSLLYELALTGRVFGARDALGLGLVSRVIPGSRDDVVREALELAREIARKSPVAVVGVKRFIAHALDHSCVHARDEFDWALTD